jgi:hypothetical protein
MRVAFVSSLFFATMAMGQAFLPLDCGIINGAAKVCDEGIGCCNNGSCFPNTGTLDQCQQEKGCDPQFSAPDACIMAVAKIVYIDEE